jgi:hypothetical protein
MTKSQMASLRRVSWYFLGDLFIIMKLIVDKMVYQFFAQLNDINTCKKKKKSERLIGVIVIKPEPTR